MPEWRRFTRKIPPRAADEAVARRVLARRVMPLPMHAAFGATIKQNVRTRIFDICFAGMSGAAE
jgi:hypothetical protein